MQPRQIHFFFDFISPYAHLAWFRMKEISLKHPEAVLLPTPVVFAAFLNQYGHKGPAEIPPKREYLFKDIARIWHRENLRIPPISPPPTHPFHPLIALRIATLFMPMGQAQVSGGDAQKRKLLFEVIDRFFLATWGGGGGVENPENLKKLLRQLDLDGPLLLEQASLPETKELLRKNTELAIKLGAFGVPTMVVDEKELFWGYDSLANLESYLKGEIPDLGDVLDRWKHLKPSASRM